jgi:hypothetical protein
MRRDAECEECKFNVKITWEQQVKLVAAQTSEMTNRTKQFLIATRIASFYELLLDM